MKKALPILYTIVGTLCLALLAGPGQDGVDHVVLFILLIRHLDKYIGVNLQ